MEKIININLENILNRDSKADWRKDSKLKGSKFGKKAIYYTASLFFLYSSLLGLGGCANNSSAIKNSINSEVLDSRGGYKLVRKDNDIYLGKSDGSETRRISKTPYKEEVGAFFTSTGNYVYYIETSNQTNKPERYFVVAKNKDYHSIKRVSGEEYNHLLREKGKD